jgi:hypothetical protein
MNSRNNRRAIQLNIETPVWQDMSLGAEGEFRESPELAVGRIIDKKW